MNQESIIITDSAKKIAIDVIDLAKKLITDGGPLSPFMVVDKNGGGKIIAFESETLEEAVAKAKEAAEKIKGHVDSYAIAYDAKLTISGEKKDAIIVEVGESGKLYIFAQCYSSVTDGAVSFLGNPKFLAGKAEFR
ncbi:hypothetical protein ONV78_17975 [Hahella sp. CR1]|uniref:hypothetical protein n=1 Tax=Hahella sp. CR1 TaxID=2992807 RepID=UPI002442978D|nr:hypothetical protein [Hahella sp. CR1]MDG9669630.1 hypothetical protein [Hahella sp. CR1]